MTNCQTVNTQMDQMLPFMTHLLTCLTASLHPAMFCTQNRPWLGYHPPLFSAFFGILHWERVMKIAPFFPPHKWAVGGGGWGSGGWQVDHGEICRWEVIRSLTGRQCRCWRLSASWMLVVLESAVCCAVAQAAVFIFTAKFDLVLVIVFWLKWNFILVII